MRPLLFVVGLQDSIVFGGNFLHGFDIGMQIRVEESEVASGIPMRFRTPLLSHMWFYAAAAYVQIARSPKFGEAVKALRAGNYDPANFAGHTGA